MMKKIDFRFVLGAIACFGLCYSLVMGKTGIEFQDAIAEMLMFIISFIGGLVCLSLIRK
jgi:hypothetical protein